jgi:rare lipoprotein A
VVLGAGALVLRSGQDEAPRAIRVDSAGGLPPVQQVPEPQPAAAVLSLADLAKEARAKTSTTSTTRVRATATTTTRPKPSTTTTSPTRTPATTATTRTAGPPAISPPTTTPLTPLTTLLEKVVPPAAAVSRSLTNSDSGVASWFGAPAATCAHRTLPMGTMVKVVRVSSGASATCKVDDRGPTVETGRLIDLSLDTFEKLADRGTGLIDVTIHW